MDPEEPMRQLRREMGDEKFEVWLKETIHEIVNSIPWIVEGQ